MYMDMYMYMYMYTYMYVCLCSCIYKYICVYVYVYMHMCKHGQQGCSQKGWAALSSTEVFLKMLRQCSTSMRPAFQPFHVVALKATIAMNGLRKNPQALLKPSPYLYLQL